MVSRQEGLNIDYLVKLKSVVKRNLKRNKFIICVGGGYTSKEYVHSSRAAVKNDYLLDWLGISVTRANAEAVKAVLYELGVYPWIVTDIREVKQAIDSSNVVIMGGLMPGITTDAVAVLAAEAAGSREMINISKVSFIYDKDPAIKGAKPIRRMDYNRLIEMAGIYDTRVARSNFIFDSIAARLARRSRIRLMFIGENISNLEAAIKGRSKGTIVT
ncbi:MAG: hypothetical protein KGH98_02765 [Candidatus Micrarchaeota archaeon]|nr:hypothetical protein [Candidatus Micrarchaeota archaeon]